MIIRVESCVGRDGMEMCQRIHLGRRQVKVVETIDQWHGSDYRYVKVSGDDGGLYILRLDESQAEWQLTMFESRRAQAISAQLHAGRQRR